MKIFSRYSFSLLLIFILALPAFSQSAKIDPPSQSALILATVREMPQGGGYSTGQDAFDALLNRIKIVNGTLAVDHLSQGPSFCSGATYFVFLKTLEKLHRSARSLIEANTTAKLLVIDEQALPLKDGFGVWGRWNANGPGTAGLFSDLNMGDNFSDDGFYEAKAGDFLKVFWRWGRGVGRFERGHSVVFTQVIPLNAKGAAVQQVCFWSSHSFDDSRQSGFGEKCVPRADIQEMIFSRLQRPGNINRVLDSAYQQENNYLSSLLDTESTIEEARLKTNTVVISPK